MKSNETNEIIMRNVRYNDLRALECRNVITARLVYRNRNGGCRTKNKLPICEALDTVWRYVKKSFLWKSYFLRYFYTFVTECFMRIISVTLSFVCLNHNYTFSGVIKYSRKPTFLLIHINIWFPVIINQSSFTVI